MTAPAVWPLIVVGGGAAGVFAALRYRECGGQAALLLEAQPRLLQKVRISGGGRCNLTNAEEDAARFVSAYPRGQRMMQRWLRRLSNRDVCRWFESQGVELKTEADGRVFPASDSSEEIITALEAALDRSQITVRRRSRVVGLQHEPSASSFELRLADGEIIKSYQVIVAMGGGPNALRLAQALSLPVAPLAPSLFSFVIHDADLQALSGLSATVRMRLPQFRCQSDGPVLITHWGLSGPATLRLSAFAARELMQCDYRSELQIDWTPAESEEELRRLLSDLRRESGGKTLIGAVALDLPRRLREYVWRRADLPLDLQSAQANREQERRLIQELKNARFTIEGKGVFKEEFVTAGGLDLDAIDNQSLETKALPGLYFVGEALDIDGLTGGYNLQAAWSSGWLAGEAAAKKEQSEN